MQTLVHYQNGKVDERCFVWQLLTLNDVSIQGSAALIWL